MPIDPTLPAGTTQEHLSFSSPGFRCKLLGSGSKVADVFSPEHPRFRNLINGFFASLVESYREDQLGVTLDANSFIHSIYKQEDLDFNHLEKAVEARKFFDRVNQIIGIWTAISFEDKVNEFRWDEIHAEQARGYSEGD